MTRAYLAAAALIALALGAPLAGAALDPTTPLITFSTPNSPADDNSPVLNGSADAGSLITVYTDSNCTGPVIAGPSAADASGAFQIQVAVPDDTTTTFYATATDATPITSPCSAGFTYVEASPPDTMIQGPPPPLTDATASFSFSGDDGSGSGVASFQCSLDEGAFAACTSPQSYSGLDSGSHSFAVRAVDQAGNVDPTPDSFSWTVDATPPPAPLLTSVPSSPSGSSSATFSFSDAEPDVAMLCQLDGGAFSTCSNGSLTYSGLADGQHTFGVKAVDAAGNQSTLTTYGWAIDTVHPLVTITDKPPLLTNRTTASFSFTANHPGSTFECRLDGGSFDSCTSPKLYNNLGNGSHTFAVRATSLGNPGIPTTYTWTVDTVPPQTAIASGPPTQSNSATASFTFASSEPGSTFACSLDASGFTPCASPKSYSGLGDGQHVFRVQAVDAAGNADASPTVYRWQIAGVGPPTVDLTPPANVSRLRRTVDYGRLQLRWRRPADRDFDHVAVYVSTSPKSQPRTLVYRGKNQSYTKKRFKNGLYYRYLVVSYDHAENASRGRSMRVPPSVLLKSPRSGQVVRTPPVLRWSAVRRATFYNVQVYYRGREKILSAWPTKPRRALARRWVYGGRGFSLRRGAYTWYVWPGFGPEAKSRYGQLLGQGTFRVR